MTTPQNAVTPYPPLNSSTTSDIILVLPPHPPAPAPVANIRHSLLDGHEGRLFSGPEQLSRSDSYQNFREGVCVCVCVHGTVDLAPVT